MSIGDRKIDSGRWFQRTEVQPWMSYYERDLRQMGWAAFWISNSGSLTRGPRVAARSVYLLK